jgi:hypothetical protein
MGVIRAPIGNLTAMYPRRDAKDPHKYQHIDAVMKGIPGTPCCAQMSHALNLAGIHIPSRSYRRANTAHTVDGTLYYYLLATDELEKFFISVCGDDGEAINLDGKGGKRTEAEIKKYIANRPGVLIFRYAGVGVAAPAGEFEHTEIWDGKKTLQRDMNEKFLFSRPRVLMWDTSGAARWLVDYMAQQTA